MKENNSDLVSMLKRPIFKYIFSILIPVVIIIMVYEQVGISFDGKLTVLTSDLNGQYVSYFAYYREKIVSGGNFFYTFSKTLGGDMAGLNGYYLLSPFNLILLFYPLNKITSAITLITIMKIGFSGLFFYIFISNGNKTKYINLIFSTSYALMTYNFAYQMHLMWLDGVLLLPLVALGINNVFEKNQRKLYIITLALAIITCYYIGYMICIFSAIYWMFLLVAKKNDIKTKIKCSISFGVSSLVAAGISSVVLIPSLMSLQGSKESNINFSGKITTNFNILDLLSKFFTSSFNSEQFFNGLPNVFSGIFVLLLVVIFFISPKIKLREKIAGVLVFAILIGSFYIHQADLIWHGFSSPNSFLYRYSFVFSFFAILLANETVDSFKDGVSMWYIMLSCLIVILIGSYVYSRDYEYIKSNYLISDLFLVIAFSFGIYFTKNKVIEYRSLSRVLVGVLALVNLYTNGLGVLNCMDYEDHSIEGFINEMQSSINGIKNADSGFYRIEKTFLYSHNDPMLLNYKGLSHFSSTEQNFVKDFMASLGYTKNYEYWTYYDRGSTVAADSLLGVKYILSRYEMDSFYDQYNYKDNIYTYYNSYALPIAWMSNEKITKVKSSSNTFEYQNKIYKAMTGGNEDVLVPIIDYSKEFINTTEYVENNHYFFDKVSTDEEGYISYSFIAKNEFPIYACLQADDMKKVTLYVNDKEIGDYFDTYHHGVISLGCFKKGDQVEFKIKLDEDKLDYEEPQIYYQDMGVFSQYIRQLKEQGLYVYEYSDNYIYGEINGTKDNQLMVFSIPYDNNFKVYVDNLEVDKIEVLDGLLAVNVDKGTHQIEIKYLPSGLKVGGSISIGSLMLCVLFNIVTFVRKKSRNRDVKYSYL